MIVRVVSTVAVVTAMLSLGTAKACPRCSDESVSESLVDARFVLFDRESRLLRFQSGEGDSRREQRIEVARDVRPIREGEAGSWGSLRRGMELQIVIREVDERQTIIRVMVGAERSSG